MTLLVSFLLLVFLSFIRNVMKEGKESKKSILEKKKEKKRIERKIEKKRRTY